MKACVLMLTCANNTEADVIAEKLLNSKLIICAKKVAVSSQFYWKGSQEHSEEILMIMDSAEELFDKVEQEIRNHHSYETFNLVALPVTKTSKGVSDWMTEGLK